MKYYKDKNNQVYAYEDDMPEFGFYTTQDVESEDGSVTTEKIYPLFTVKEGLISISEDEANAIVSDLLEKKKNVVPYSITKRQAMLQLNKAGLYEQVVTLINDADNLELKIEFDCASVFERDSKFINATGYHFNFSDSDINNLFIKASKL